MKMTCGVWISFLIWLWLYCPEF